MQVGIVLVAAAGISQVAVGFSLYPDVTVTVGPYLVSLLTLAALWRAGPRGLSLAVSVIAGLIAILLVVYTALHIGARGMVEGPRFWINYWVMFIPAVLGLGRPPEEPICIGGCLSLVDGLIMLKLHISGVELEGAPNTALGPIVLAIGGSAVTLALRGSVSRARQVRAEVFRVQEKTRVAAAARAERHAQLEGLDQRIAPLLQDIASGKRRVNDPDVAVISRRLVQHLRSEQTAADRSVVTLLLESDIATLESGGGRLEIYDVDAGYRLYSADRLALVALVRELCRAPGPSAGRVISLSLRSADSLGYANRVQVILQVNGVASPESDDLVPLLLSGSTTNECVTNWWWDRVYPSNPAPVLESYVALP